MSLHGRHLNKDNIFQHSHSRWFDDNQNFIENCKYMVAILSLEVNETVPLIKWNSIENRALWERISIYTFICFLLSLSSFFFFFCFNQDYFCQVWSLFFHVFLFCIPCLLSFFTFDEKAAGQIFLKITVMKCTTEK